MNEQIISLLNKNGWHLIKEEPVLSIAHEDGSSAIGLGAVFVIEHLKCINQPR